MKIFFKLQLVLPFLLAVHVFTGCGLFSYPEGETEIVSTYTTDSGDYHYLTAVLKISNTGSKSIYSSTISLQADSSIRTYYKTQSTSTVIKPGNHIFFSVEFQFEDEDSEGEDETESSDSAENNGTEDKEKWLEDSVKIADQFWN